jgi:hypothetical protein
LEPRKQASPPPLPQATDEDAIVPFPLYASILSSQLIIAVADRVPQFDVKPGCRDSSVHDCMNMEKIAREKLVEAWPNFTAQDKATCVMEEKIAGPPSYVGWLTCLQINANGRKVESASPSIEARAEAKPGTRGRISSGIHRRHSKL